MAPHLAAAEVRWRMVGLANRGARDRNLEDSAGKTQWSAAGLARYRCQSARPSDDASDRQCALRREKAALKHLPLAPSRRPRSRAHQDDGVAAALTNSADPQTKRATSQKWRSRSPQRLLAGPSRGWGILLRAFREDGIGICTTCRFSLLFCCPDSSPTRASKGRRVA